MRTNWVKRKLLEGQTVVGTMMCEFATTGIPRIAAEAGAEFAVYDLEVTGWTMETIRILMASSRPEKMVPLVRIPVIEDHFISRALDLGAMGLAIPQVETEEEARAAVAWAKYPPDGRRNVCFGIAQDDYGGGDIVEKMAAFNRESLLVAHIESVQGLDNADRIAAVDGIDVIWIGQYDLTALWGYLGNSRIPCSCVQPIESWTPAPGTARQRDLDLSTWRSWRQLPAKATGFSYMWRTSGSTSRHWRTVLPGSGEVSSLENS